GAGSGGGGGNTWDGETVLDSVGGSGGDDAKLSRVSAGKQVSNLECLSRCHNTCLVYDKKTQVDNDAVEMMIAMDRQTNKNQTGHLHFVNSGTDVVDLQLSDSDRAWTHGIHVKRFASMIMNIIRDTGDQNKKNPSALQTLSPYQASTILKKAHNRPENKAS
ncbi:hypothetical protein RRG08_062521, partial [Elysia crispata]